MSLISRRRISRLYDRVESVVAERERREPEVTAWRREVIAWRRQAALDHATKLATLILHGDPQFDEPLAIAWERALGHLGLSRTPQELLPDRLRAVLEGLPGDTEIAEFAHIFRSSPSWLLDFCNASVDCFVLGIELPKSSEPAPAYGRDRLRDASDAWPDLPKGTIGAGYPIPKPNPLCRLSPEEIIDLIGLLERGEGRLLPPRDDRHRQREIMAKVHWASWLAGCTSSLDEGATEEK